MGIADEKPNSEISEELFKKIVVSAVQTPHLPDFLSVHEKG